MNESQFNKAVRVTRQSSTFQSKVVSTSPSSLSKDVTKDTGSNSKSSKSKPDDVLSGSGASSSKNKGKHEQYVKLDSLTVADSVKDTAAYEILDAILSRLQVQATNAMFLRQTSRRVFSFADKLKEELSKHRQILTGEKVVPDSDVNIEQEETLEDKLLRMNNSLTQGELERKHRTSSGSNLSVNEDLVIKTMPIIESSVLKLVRRIRLLSPLVIDTVEAKMMTILTASDLLEDIHSKLLGLIAPLQDIELRGSSSLAQLDPKVQEVDLKDLITGLKAALEELNNSEDFRDNNDMFQLVHDIFNLIEEAEANFAKPADIIKLLKPNLEKMVSFISNAVDFDISNVKSEDFDLGEYSFTDDFGDCFGGFMRKDNQEFKVFSKIVSFRDGLSAKTRRELQVEVQMMKRYTHENVSVFYGTCVRLNELHLIWEFYEKNLFMEIFDSDEIGDMQHIQNRQILKYILDILEGLEFLHNNGIIHQDLTTKNIFTKELVPTDASYSRLGSKKAVLGDFCFIDGKREAKKVQNVPGYDFSRTYRAPETLTKNHRYQGEISVFASDIYSFAVIFFELLERKKAYRDLDLENFKKKVLGKSPRRPNLSKNNLKFVPQILQEALARSWQQKPELRPTANELIRVLKLEAGELETELGEDEQTLDEAEAENPEMNKKKKEVSEDMKNWLEGVCRKQEEEDDEE